VRHLRYWVEERGHKFVRTPEVNAAELRAAAAPVCVDMQEGAGRPISGLRRFAHSLRPDLCAHVRVSFIILVRYGHVAGNDEHESRRGLCGRREKKPDPLVREGVRAFEVGANSIEKWRNNLDSCVHCSGLRWLAMISRHDRVSATPLQEHAYHVLPKMLNVFQFWPLDVKRVEKYRRVA
jgi:hypothetical protein